MDNIAKGAEGWWYDDDHNVIAHAVNWNTSSDFGLCAVKDDYSLFLGWVNTGKGIDGALQIAQALGQLILAAGAGELSGNQTVGHPPVSVIVILPGPFTPAKHRMLLSKAKALLAPSLFSEPFCGFQI